MARSRIASAQGSEQRTVVPIRRAAAPDEPLRLNLLGIFSIRQRGRALPALPKKAQALLAYLAMQNGRAGSREQLADLFWANSGSEQSRRSLRQCLMSIRTALKGGAESVLLADGDKIGIAPGHAIAVDVAEFERLAASQDIDDLYAAQVLYGGEFLSGLHIESEPFTEWLLIERRRRASAMSDVLFRLASARGQAGDLQAAIADAERLAAFDPLREDGHRLLMRLLVEAGRRSAALEQYERCAELLRRELGVSPEPATAEIAQAIRGGGTTGSPDSRVTPKSERTLAPALALPDKPSIALLPFENLSGSQDQDYFASGIADDLTIALGRIPWLFVIAAASTSRYRGQTPDVGQVGAELGVRYVLRGSVRKSGQRLRVVVQLADALDGRHIWSDRFDGELDDVFAIQDQVTTQVSGFIAPALQVAEIDRARRTPTESLSAYDLYLRAVPRFRASIADNQESLRLLRKAIAIDPGYGAAYGFAARCYQFQKLLGWVPLADPALEEGVRLGETAADIGQNDSEALWMAGLSLAQMVGRVDHGRALLDRSLVLNPNSANAWIASCHIHACLGDAATAIEHYHRASRLNPLDASQHVGWNVLSLAHMAMSDFEAADRTADRAISAAPTYVPGLRIKVSTCGMLGRDGREAVARLRAQHPTASVAWLQGFWGPSMRQAPQLLENLVEGARRAGLPDR